MSAFGNLAGVIAAVTVKAVPAMAWLLTGGYVREANAADTFSCCTSDLEEAAYYVPRALGTDDVGFALAGGVAERPVIIAVAALALMIRDEATDEMDRLAKHRACATIVRTCSEIADGALGFYLPELPEAEMDILLSATADAAEWLLVWAGREPAPMAALAEAA